MRNLVELADAYLACRVDLSDKHVRAVRSVARRCQEASGNGHLPTGSEIAAWLRTLRQEGRSLATLRDYATILGSLYRHGLAAGAIDRLPQLPKVRLERRLPEAWTPEEVSRLIDAAGRLRGRVAWCPAPRALWWQTLLLACWYSAARLNAILAMTWDDLDLTKGVMTLRSQASKTRMDAMVRLPRSACEAIDRLPRASDLVWIPPRKRHTLWENFRRISQTAGVRCPPGARQCFHRLRRSALSVVAARDLEAARRLAGHTTAAITLAHYVDPRVAGLPQVVVPEISVAVQARQLTLF